jgi:hypothetical protein
MSASQPLVNAVNAFPVHAWLILKVTSQSSLHTGVEIGQKRGSRMCTRVLETRLFKYGIHTLLLCLLPCSSTFFHPI